MDIYIQGNLPKSETEDGSSIKLRLPVLPEAINIKSAADFASYKIMDVGEIKIPSGMQLDEISWNTFFPGEGRAGAPWLRGDFFGTETYIQYFTTWMKYGVKLSITISDTSISEAQFYISSFEQKPSGGYGDVEYSVTFVQAKDIVITTSAKEKTKRTTKTKATTYVIKKGDTLFKIAKKFYGKGSYHTKLYNKNKSVIEKAAKKHGKKSSNNGKYLYAGTKITIPEINGGNSSSSNKTKVTYYPKYKGNSGSIVDALKSLGINTAMSNRKKIATLNGIKNYSGKSAQNSKMLSLLKSGKLIKSK